jgi:ubiquinone/menaquinone biosynthesis C-methylase UbiE
MPSALDLKFFSKNNRFPMSLYVFMKFLESAPGRYDRGIRILSLGLTDKAYDRLVSSIGKGWKVLDIGCGTGALTLRAARKGATVTGIDINAGMLEIARQRAGDMDLLQYIEFREMGVAELGVMPSQTYDAVMSGLCFSELSGDELTFTLRHIRRILKDGGLLLIADEIVPSGFYRHMLNLMIRIPLQAVTWLLTQAVTHAVRDLPEQVEEAGLQVHSVRKNKMGNFIELIAIKHGEGAA